VSRHRTAALGLLAALLAILAGSCRDPVEDRPNIIVLLVDTLRADHLGCYGFPGEISPNLDRLAGESVVFENCYANAPWTPPSVGTMFTSLYPQVHGLNRFTEHQFRDPDSGRLRGSVLTEDAVTLAETLRDAGYSTAGFVANPWLEGPLGLSQGFDFYDDSTVSKTVPAMLLTVAAEEWIEKRPRGEPFFLYLHFMDVHEPYRSPRKDFDALWKKMSDGDERVLSSAPPDYLERKPPWADDELRKRVAYWRTRYAAGVRLFDRRVAGFLDFLRESGLLDRSYVVLTSDHGEELHEHSGWGHGENLHEHQLRVPLIIRPPEPARPARRVASHVRLIDLMPTLLAVAGVEPPAGLQGVDFAGLLRGEAVAAPLPVFANGVVGEPDVYSLIDGRYKLVVDLEGDSPALYDLESDPGELANVASREPDVVASMLEQLEVHIAETTAVELEQETVELPEELQKPLRALGYLD
jgi:arylsulfatase A-like enzyme